MIRQISIWTLAAACAVPAALADRADRAERTRAQQERFTARGSFTDSARGIARSFRESRGKTMLRSAAGDKRAAWVMAPGVAQINLFDSGREAYFVAADVIPAGSTVQAFILLPDGQQEWALEALNVTEDLPVGYSFVLPGIKTLGDFWQTGLTTYLVVVTLPNGDETVSAFDFATKGYFRDATDTTSMVPGISWWRQYYGDDGVAFLEIKGRFLSDARTYVVFEDIVAPQDAIRVVDSSTIVVNLSAVPNFDTTRLKGYLLTVGQAAWTDTVPFRYTPLQ